MRGRTSAREVGVIGSLRSTDESGLPLSMLIRNISFLFMFPTVSFVLLLMKAMLLRRQKSISVGAEALKVWTDL